MPPTVNLHKTIIIDAPLEQLWPLLSDTDRTNRLIGIPASERYEPGEDGARIIHSHYLGIPVTWQDNPFQWVFEQWFESDRAFKPPFPIERIFTNTRLRSLAERRTEVDVEVRVAPRNVLGRLTGVLVIGQRMLGKLVQVYKTLGEMALRQEELLPPPHPPVINRERLALGLQRLRQSPVRPDLVEQLAHHLRTTDDPDVLRMRPFALADRWQAPRDETLRLFLYATRAGLLDLEWDILCPNCRGASKRTPTLAELVGETHCPSCDVRYDVNFDESVELRFAVSGDVREAYDVSYCVGGPANTRHIVSQLWLPPHNQKQIKLRLPEGSYHVRIRQSRERAKIEALPGAAEQLARIRFDGPAATLEPAVVAPGEVLLDIDNTSDQNLLVILEQGTWSSQAASAARVTALEEFRELFSSEVLAPGLGLAVRNLTFMFSDLKDSTTIYDTIGDAPAFARVRDHFDIMRATIGRNRGALVKTIGDAVMAVFPSAEDAVAASIDIQREFIMGEIAHGRPALRVKLGLHRGPCIAVNANDLLDYFGSTVNIAARVQNESAGGDIVVTPDILSDPGVQRFLDAGMRVESFERMLKGVRQKFTLHRLWIPESDMLDAAAPHSAPSDVAAQAALQAASNSGISA